MRPTSPRCILLFQKSERGVTLTQAELRAKFGFEPDGVNGYFGINAAAVERFRGTGSALNDTHRAVLKDLRDRLVMGDQREKSLDFGLWPYQPERPYAFVGENLALVERLAVELAGYQEEAHQWGKSLRIVVRYASEMNDPAKPSQPWGRGPLDDPEHQRAFKDTFRAVREVFRKRAPEVRFSFSPALRRDNAGERFRIIADYWPGDGLVDYVGGTWYVGREADLPAAVELLRRYTAEHRPKGLRFGIDELGGVAEDRDNDRILQAMLTAAEDLKAQGVEFDYASIFLDGNRWGKDATLAFLRP